MEGGGRQGRLRGLSEAVARPALTAPRLRANPHLAAIRARFGALGPPAAMPGLERVVLLCFTNRTGSNFLGSLLAGTRLMNVPQEWLDEARLSREAASSGIDGFATLFAHIVATTAVGGRFALKTSPAHLEVLGEAGLLELWAERLQLIHIERADRLGQAISWEIAVQTGSWHSQFAPSGTAAYRRAGIDAALETFAEANRQLALFYGRNGLVPHHVLYEALDARPAETVARLLAEMGLPAVRVEPELVPIRRQAGAVNREWRERYLRGE